MFGSAQITAATSALVVLFSSSSAVVQFFLLGRIPVYYALAFGGVCICASLMGVVVVGRLVKRSGRPSIIALILAGLIVTCTGERVAGVTGGRARERLQSARMGHAGTCARLAGGSHSRPRAFSRSRVHRARGHEHRRGLQERRHWPPQRLRVTQAA